MKIAVLGTGMVGNAIGTRLVELGHHVMMGSRTAGNSKAMDWLSKNKSNGNQGTFADASKFGEIIFNCTNGMGTLEALKMAGPDNLKGKVIVDISNPLDFSKGMPPSLFVSNTSSLAEQIQEKYPEAKVVKTLNTMSCHIMVKPAMLANGDHNVFICGNDAGAKSQVKGILGQFGWKAENIMDLGDIKSSRGSEMILPIWLSLMGSMGTGAFNFKIVK